MPNTTKPKYGQTTDKTMILKYLRKQRKYTSKYDVLNYMQLEHGAAHETTGRRLRELAACGDVNRRYDRDERGLVYQIAKS